MERTASASGNVSVGDHVIGAGLLLAGQRVTLRLDGPIAHVLSSGTLVRTVACPIPEHARARLRGARAGAAEPPRLAWPLQVRRRVSIPTAIMVGGQRVQVGLAHAGKTAEVTIEADSFQDHGGPGIVITASARTTSRAILRQKASRYDATAVMDRT